MNKEHWTWVCPICGETIEEDYTIDEIKEYIWASHDCPECGGLVQITEDLTCIDFGEKLVGIYKEMGLDVTKEQACGTYMTIREFLEKAKQLTNSGLFDEILDHEVKIHMHTENGMYIGNSFGIDGMEYKFSPWHTNSDGTKGALVFDMHIINKKD